MAMAGAFVVDVNDELVEAVAEDAVEKDVAFVDDANVADDAVDDVLVVDGGAVVDNAVVVGGSGEAVVGFAAAAELAVGPFVAELLKLLPQRLA